MQKIVSFVFIVLVLVFGFFIAGCTDAPHSREVLRKQGFTDVEITGYVWMACSEDDTYHTGFRAKNPQGIEVEGVVCCGLVKSCTVRW